MLGTIVNFLSVIIGGSIGLALKGGIPKKISDTVMNGIALCVIYIGISGALEGKDGLVIILSIALGGVIGEILDIDKLLTKLGNKLESKFKGTSKISEGFVSSSLLFCVGAMAIMGSLQSGLNGKHDILFTKSILDGISSIVFASTLGIGVLISSISVFLYQGTITLCASLLKTLLEGNVGLNMNAVGSLLIMGLGLNMLGITKIKIANLLPAMLIPIVYGIVINLF